MVDFAKIQGTVVSGVGKAAYFTQLEWVQTQCHETLGFNPYPGTLNVEISAADRLLIESLARHDGAEWIPPGSGFCAAKVLPLRVGSLSGALVLPAREVRIHEDKIVEVMAPLCLREILHLEEGDAVVLFLRDRSRLVREGVDEPGLFLSAQSGDATRFLKAIIFDLDGTLIDTIPLYFRMVDAVAERLQMPPVSRNTVVEAIQDGGFEWGKILPWRTERHREELNARAMGIVQELAPTLFREEVALFAGVDGLLRSIAKWGVRMGVATSTRRHHLDYKLIPLKKAGLDRLFQAVITADDVARNKPAPDPLLACAKKMGVAARDCLYVGDMRMDIRAGRAAGMTTVGVLTGFDNEPSLKSLNPHLVLECVTALNKRLTP